MLRSCTYVFSHVWSQLKLCYTVRQEFIKVCCGTGTHFVVLDMSVDYAVSSALSQLSVLHMYYVHICDCTTQ